ncbi:MAG TPA: GTP 3',8-cyclase MoaA [Actinomycetaceae bacterium]|nr:GTP 3',8-cyclase MoaA [Actinomycetaceae bacterium]
MTAHGGTGIAQSRAAPDHADLRLRDRFGRVARDLRVSLTDRCNLRCTYCMPAEGLQWLPTRDTLDDGEITRLIRIAVEELGIRAVRFTGGEPLLRRSLERIVAFTASLRTDEGARPDIALTTNGLGLAHRAAALKEAGLERVNISLDAVDPAVYASITRRDRFHDVVDAIDAALRTGLEPVKINTVLMRGVNEDQTVPLARFCVEKGLHLRFIEQMPLGPHMAWDRAEIVKAEEIRGILAGEFELEPVPRDDPSAPAARWWASPKNGGRGGDIGIIASVTEPFCGACDRTRLTSDGQMRTCLFARTETDLRSPLRAGAGDREIALIWARGMREKKAGHGIDDPGFIQPERGMSAIGG